MIAPLLYSNNKILRDFYQKVQQDFLALYTTSNWVLYWIQIAQMLAQQFQKILQIKYVLVTLLVDKEYATVKNE